jgi:hypothetical protein
MTVTTLVPTKQSFIWRHRFLLGWVIVFSLYIGLLYVFRYTIPQYDGSFYLHRCLTPLLEESSPNLLKLSCFGHPSFGYMIIMYFTLLITKHSLVAMNMVNGLLWGFGVVALYYSLMRKAFAKQYAIEFFLLGIIILFNPVVIANLFSLNIDTGALIFFCLFLSSIVLNNRILIILTGLGFLMTKEIVIPIFALMVILIMFIYRRRIVFKKRWFLEGIILSIPVWCFGLYFILRKHYDLPLYWDVIQHLGIEVFEPHTATALRFSTLLMFFVFQYAWVYVFLFITSVVIIIYAVLKKRKPLIPYSLLLLFIVSLFTVAVGSMIFVTFSIPRYFMIATISLQYCSLVLWIFVVRNKPIRIGVLIMCVCMTGISLYTSIDPVTRLIWGVFPFGSRSMYSMTSITHECCGHGRDQLLYNLQYIQFQQLLQRMYKDIKPTENTLFVTHADAIRESEYIPFLNKETFSYSIDPERSFKPKWVFSNDLITLGDIKNDFIYVEFPQFTNDTFLPIIQYTRTLEEEKIYRNGAYELKVLYYSK